MSLEKKATLVASSVATLLIFIKLIVGIASGSVAVLASAIDSMMDVGVSLFNYFALQNSEKEADEQFNYGRSKIEPIASVIEGVVITLSGLYILYASVLKIIDEHTTVYVEESIGIMIFSLLITTLLVVYLGKVAKETGNMVIKADALHYKTDVLSNGAIIISLIVVHFSGWHLVDALMGVAIALYVIYSAYELIHDGVLMLMDAALEDESVEEIKNILASSNITDYHWLKTRKSGKDNFVTVHLVFHVQISLLDAHRISDEVEAKIRAIDYKSKWHFAIHLDPYDDSEINEEDAYYDGD